MCSRIRLIGNVVGLVLISLLFLTCCPIKATYTLTVAISPDGSGSVVPEPDQAKYEEDTTVHLTATAGGDWVFDHWEGDASGSANPASVQMDDDKAVTAVFAETLPSSKALLSFGFASPAATGTLDEGAHTVTVGVPAGTNVTGLVGVFTSTGAQVKVGSTVQVSGTTANDFTNSVTYTVVAEDTSTQDYVVTVLNLPAEYTQKVLIEEVTGTWCPYCPDGAYRLQQLVDANPGKVFGAAYHWSDALAISEVSAWGSGLGGVPFYPSGAVNRTEYLDKGIIIGRGYWPTVTATALAQTAPCGLRIVSEVVGSTASIDVFTGFYTTVTSELRLTILLTEDEITGYPQQNWYDKNDPTSPFYEKGDPIVDFVHQHVVRGFVTPVLGDTIAAVQTVAGACSTFSYNYTVPAGWVKANVSVVALVNGYGLNLSDMQVINVQKVTLGGTQDWD